MRFEATTLLKTKEVDWERTQIRSQFEAVFGLNWLGLGLRSERQSEILRFAQNDKRWAPKLESECIPRIEFPVSSIGLLTNETGMSFRINRYALWFLPLVPNWKAQENASAEGWAPTVHARRAIA